MIRAFARGAQRLRRNVRALAGGAFPSSDRWAPNLVSASDTPTTPVLVLQKDEYEAWLGEQAADTQSYLKAAGLAKFKDDALVLLPERKWAFMTKNASSLYAFASLPARLPSDGAVYELESAEPLPATAALSWGLGCYSFDACKGTGSQPKADDPPKFASLVVPAAADDYATSLKGTYLCSDQCGNQPVRQAGLEVLFIILAASMQHESAWRPRTRRLRLIHPNV